MLRLEKNNVSNHAINLVVYIQALLQKASRLLMVKTIITWFVSSGFFGVRLNIRRLILYELQNLKNCCLCSLWAHENMLLLMNAIFKFTTTHFWHQTRHAITVTCLPKKHTNYYYYFLIILRRIVFLAQNKELTAIRHYCVSNAIRKVRSCISYWKKRVNDVN